MASLLYSERKKRKLAQAVVAEQLGINAGNLSRIERGITKPRPQLMQRIAEYYDLPLSDVEADFAPQPEISEDKQQQTVQSSQNIPMSTLEDALVESYRHGLAAARQLTPSTEVVQIPIIGETAAGYGFEASMDNTGSTVTLPREMLRDTPGSYFALKVRGQSMEPELRDGDTAIIHQQTTLNNGEIGLVVYGDDMSSIGTYGTLKRVNVSPGQIMLIPINPEYETVTIAGDDLGSVQIQGRLVHVLRSY